MAFQNICIKMHCDIDTYLFVICNRKAIIECAIEQDEQDLPGYRIAIGGWGGVGLVTLKFG